MNGQKRRVRVFALLLVSALLVAAIASADTVAIATIQDWNDLVAKATAQVGGAGGFTDKNVIINVTGDIANITQTLVFADDGWDITINGGDHTLSGGGSTQLIRIGDMTANNNTVSMTDLTMENGNATGAVGETGSGGALFVGGDVTLDDCTFTDNSAALRGGAVYVTGEATITDSDFSANSADVGGGGVYAGGDATITGGTFDGNSANTGGGVYAGEDASITGSTFDGNIASIGGGVYAGEDANIMGGSFNGNIARLDGGGVYAAQDANITGGSFVGNSASTKGGGVAAFGDANITGSTFDGNSVGDVKAGMPGTGGGVYANQNANIMGGTFTGNTAIGDGGGVFTMHDASITGGTFTGNTATGNGGGVVAAQDANITGSTFDGNTADRDGGAVNMNAGSITGSKFEGNSAGGRGGAAFAENSFSKPQDNLTITNGEFYNNTAQSGGGAIDTHADVIMNGTNYFDSNTPDGSADHGINVRNATFTLEPGASIVDGRKPTPPTPPTPSGGSGRASSGGTRPVDYQTARIRAQGGTAPVLEQANKNANVIGQAKDGEAIRLIQWAAGETYCKILYDGGNRAGWVAGQYIQP